MDRLKTCRNLRELVELTIKSDLKFGVCGYRSVVNINLNLSINYSRAPLTRTLKENEKFFALVGARVSEVGVKFRLLG